MTAHELILYVLLWPIPSICPGVNPQQSTGHLLYYKIFSSQELKLGQPCIFYTN